MRLLADTHVILWALQDPARLPLRMAERLTEAEAVFVSAASIWEMRIKHDLGRLALVAPPLALALSMVRGDRERVLPITPDHVAHRLVAGPDTRDPFDQILLAQCAMEGLRLLTVDAKLTDHPLAVAPGDAP